MASSPDIIMTDWDVCPTNRGESKSPLLGLRRERSVERGDKGVGYELAYIRKVVVFCKVKPNLINVLEFQSCRRPNLMYRNFNLVGAENLQPPTMKRFIQK